ncbi:hypothetical protein QJS66_00825 [Kocuria rhizophila]|nr:hypothetical protein QJS66_00825 [Kocuria rhizophila]
MDVSDGLLKDAGRIARASGVRIDVDPGAGAGRHPAAVGRGGRRAGTVAVGVTGGRTTVCCGAACGFPGRLRSVR